MSIHKFVPNNKGKFEGTSSGKKRVFPPEWYAAQAARRKIKSDGTYKEGEFKTNRTHNEIHGAKEKRVMPQAWHDKQALKAKERKDAQAAGESVRNVRGKRSEYKDKGIPADLKTGRRKIDVDGSYDVAGFAVTQARKGSIVEIEHKGKNVELTIKGDGFYPLTRVGISASGETHIVNTSNIVSAWVL